MRGVHKQREAFKTQPAIVWRICISFRYMIRANIICQEVAACYFGSTCCNICRRCVRCVCWCTRCAVCRKAYSTTHHCAGHQPLVRQVHASTAHHHKLRIPQTSVRTSCDKHNTKTTTHNYSRLGYLICTCTHHLLGRGVCDADKQQQSTAACCTVQSTVQNGHLWLAVQIQHRAHQKYT